MKDNTIKRAPGFKFAISGLLHTYKSEKNFRYHLLIMILVILFGVIINISKTEWLFIAIATGLVLMAELFNTSVELFVDFISTDFNEKAGKIKDVSAAAVLITAITSIVVGLIIFVPYLIEYF